MGCGHPLGATGVAQAAEIWAQLRGEAGPRQVAGARIGLTHNNSGMGEHVVMLYGAEPAMTYVRAVDPLPLESAEHNKLHAFYEHLAAGRLVTTRCRGCGRTDWPPRGFCPECISDEFDWAELPAEGTVHAFTVQDAGVPAGWTGPLVFAVVKVAGLRVFAPIVASEPTRVARWRPGHAEPGAGGGRAGRSAALPRGLRARAGAGVRPLARARGQTRPRRSRPRRPGCWPGPSVPPARDPRQASSGRRR